MTYKPKYIPKRSTFEDKVGKDLDERNVSYEYEPFSLEYIPKVKRYTPDYVLDNGIIIEVKGYLDVSARTKMLLVQKYNPDKDIRFVFQNAKNKINKNSKTTYADWCDKHGFPWAEGKVPEEWLTE